MRFFFFWIFLIFSPALAQAENPPVTKAQIQAAVAGVGDQDSVPVLLTLNLQPGWKTYWRTPGEAGLAPAFDWQGSQNLDAVVVQWPAPHRYTFEDMDNLVYTETVSFPLTAKLKEKGQALSLRLKLDLLVCNKICLPETQLVQLDIPQGAAMETPAAKAYADAIKNIPLQQNNIFTKAYLNFDNSNNTYLVVEAAADHAPTSTSDILVENEAGLFFGKARVAYDAVHQQALFTAPIHSTDPLDKLLAQLQNQPLTLTWIEDGRPALEGIVTLGPRPPAIPSVETQHNIVTDIAEQSKDGAEIALLAFLGGLILNLMPCVLPVLSLKILSVLSHGTKGMAADTAEKSKRRVDIFRNFTATGFGILFSFWILAASLSGLKSAGELIGWGIQFQNPWFLGFLIVVVLIFAASMWGFFDIPLPRFIARNIPARHTHDPTLFGHFLTGAFATLLATPCTAPFLGTAVGFGLSRGTREIFAIFTLIGLGLAAPYFVLAASPGLFRFFPRPGAWMTKVKKLLSLALLLTALWLGSVLSTIVSAPTLDEGWTALDTAVITPAVESGKVVIVDVTADWCLTCKANKRLVLEDQEVMQALSGPEIVRLQGDWTHRDEKITLFLQKYGRYGIPFNIVYGPATPDGIVLPELLTKKAVLDALAQAAGE